MKQVAKSILIVEDERTTRYFLSKILKATGTSVATAKDGFLAWQRIQREKFDLVLLDVWMPRLNGLELLARLRTKSPSPKVLLMTSDDTPETLLRAIREQAYGYITKPIQAKELVEMVQDALAASPSMPPIEVLSANPNWVELQVPCALGLAERIQSFLAHLDTDLSEEIRHSVGRVFREMLLNAIEWGGQLDPNRKVRISYLRLRRLLLYRIADPGPGFRFENLTHAAISNPEGQPMEHMRVREERGLRPGGFGILIARAMVDELLYNEAQNEVLFVKYLD